MVVKDSGAEVEGMDWGQAWDDGGVEGVEFEHEAKAVEKDVEGMEEEEEVKNKVEV